MRCGCGAECGRLKGCGCGASAPPHLSSVFFLSGGEVGGGVGGCPIPTPHQIFGRRKKNVNPIKSFLFFEKCGTPFPLTTINYGASTSSTKKLGFCNFTPHLCSAPPHVRTRCGGAEGAGAVRSAEPICSAPPTPELYIVKLRETITSLQGCYTAQKMRQSLLFPTQYDSYYLNNYRSLYALIYRHCF